MRPSTAACLAVSVLLTACTPSSSGETDTDLAGDTDIVGDSDTDVVDDTVDTDPVDTGPTACTPSAHAIIVTDIDETLTTSDNEWLTQLANPSHDPEMRPEADTLMRAWRDKGYRIVYVSARGSDLPLLDGTDPREATEDWLTAHGFPFQSADVYLASGVGALGSSAGPYKTEVLQGLIAAGDVIGYAYGNADTDVEPYRAVGVPDDHDFLVGALAGSYGVYGVPDSQAYALHVLDWPGDLPCAD